MCYLLTEHFSGIFLFLCMICYKPLSVSVCATSLSSSQEIKKIFSPNVTVTVLKGAPQNEDFTEGGLINTHLNKSTSAISINHFAKNSLSFKNVLHDKSFLKKQNNSCFSSKISENKSLNSYEPSTTTNSLPTKLAENVSNLFLGVPEVIHVNGTSSIKPRKGVHYNKIVPRKGVDNDNESKMKNDFSENEYCFQITGNKCYSATGLYGVDCSCCQEDNALGKIVKLQDVVNCKKCKPLNMLSPDKEICKNICCFPVNYDVHDGSTTHNIPNNFLNYKTVTDDKKQSAFGTKISKLVRNFTKEIVTEIKDDFVNSNKHSKLKPGLTKVPYDVEVVTELLSKTQQKVLVPIVVSLFLIPLLGILLFFIWRRTKEYWDKRYYKRMDFLIDGIYND